MNEFNEMKNHAVTAVNNWLYGEYKGKFKEAVTQVMNEGYKESELADALFEAVDECCADYYERLHSFSHSFDMSVEEMTDRE